MHFNIINHIILISTIQLLTLDISWVILLRWPARVNNIRFMS